MGDLDARTKELEAIVLDDDLPAEEKCGGREFAEVVGGFHARLAPGMPVHVRGLTSREDLNGRAGIVAGWNKAKSRWQVQVGTETVLI